MEEPYKSHWSEHIASLSLAFFCVTLIVWYSDSPRFTAGGGGDFGVLGDLFVTDLIGAGGLVTSWLLALTAARKSRFGVWLAILEAPLVLVAAVMALRWFMV